MPVPLTWLAHSPGTSLSCAGAIRTGGGGAWCWEAAAKAYAAGIAPHLVAGDADGEHRRRFQLLRRILAGGFPNVPGVVVVDDAARGYGHIEYAGAEFVGGQRQVACVAGQQAALPVGDAFAGRDLVLFFRRQQHGQLGMAPVDQVLVR